MRVLAVLACAAFMLAACLPAAAGESCVGGHCARLQRYGAPYGFAPGYIDMAKHRCPAPAGWGFYLQQKLRQDCKAPLVIVDEPGGVTLIRGRR